MNVVFRLVSRDLGSAAKQVRHHVVLGRRHRHITHVLTASLALLHTTMIDTKHDTAVDNMEELLFFDSSKVSICVRGLVGVLHRDSDDDVIPFTT